MIGARLLPPELLVAVKAIACELPAQLGLPLSRLHVSDIRASVINRGLVASISGATIWQWLSEGSGARTRTVNLAVKSLAGGSQAPAQGRDRDQQPLTGEPCHRGVFNLYFTALRFTSWTPGARMLSAGVDNTRRELDEALDELRETVPAMRPPRPASLSHNLSGASGVRE